MGDMGDFFREYKEIKRLRKIQNQEKYQKQWDEFIKNNKCKKLSEYHYRFFEFDFWISTGTFLNRKTGQKGNGIKSFIKRISL